MSRRRLGLLLLLSTLVVGCSDSLTNPAAPSWLAPSRSGARFEVSLNLSSTILAPGEPLQFALVVSNVGDAPGVLHFASGCLTDFVVRSQGGLVWDDRLNRVCTMNAPSLDVLPGEPRTFRGTWNQQISNGTAPPGSYRIEVQAMSVPHLPALEASFSIRPNS